MKLCSVQNCGLKHYGLSFCNRHYFKWKKYGDVNVNVRKIDGHSRHPLYHSWANMVRRCSNPIEQDKRFYKDRGITVCERWLGVDGFNNFLADMGERSDGMSLDRQDNSKGYSPDNCRWATPHQQAANTRRNKSGRVGVTYVKHRGTWDARIMVDRKVILLGTFHDKNDALKAREDAEKIYNIVL